MIREEQVYNALNYHWQTGQAIRQKVADSIEKKRTHVNTGTIYAYLDSLVQQGFAEMRKANLTAEELQRRKGCGANEYRKVGEKEYSERQPEGVPELVPLIN